jgi:uncharacterized membrane protein YphA (DoxX/SURF4 family)
MNNTIKNHWESLFITVLRAGIGWHFFYEGLSKLVAGNWSAQSYLSNTAGFASDFYHWLASSPDLIRMVDLLNIYGLMLIGLALFTGLFFRFAAACGVLLLALYYFAYPPFGASLLSAYDGSLYIVDKIFVEAAALVFLFFSGNKGYSMDTLIQTVKDSGRKRMQETSQGEAAEAKAPNTRREALKHLATLPVLGVMGVGAYQTKKQYGVDVMSGATIQVNQLDISELKGKLPKGKIGRHTISRLVLGGNLIGGWSHSRDLLYVDSLFKAYNNERKVYETLMLAEKAGIDTINIGFPSNALMQKYKKATGSKIKVISQVASDVEKLSFDNIMEAIDFGVDIIQVQGNWCDWMVRDGQLENIMRMIDKIREEGYTAGLASHTVDALIACEANGILPDYYMKTMHHDRYWSAHPMENRVPFEVDGEAHLDHNRYHNNMYCLFPERTAEFVQKTQIPVMGFKVLAAGAITPEDGFRWAFENGADFICVGMFDFQIVRDVNICLDVLASLPGRKREWYG